MFVDRASEVDLPTAGPKPAIPAMSSSMSDLPMRSTPFTAQAPTPVAAKAGSAARARSSAAAYVAPSASLDQEPPHGAAAAQVQHGRVAAVLADAVQDFRQVPPPVGHHVAKELSGYPVEQPVGVLAAAVAQPSSEDSQQAHQRARVEHDDRVGGRGSPCGA